MPVNFDRIPPGYYSTAPIRRLLPTCLMLALLVTLAACTQPATEGELEAGDAASQAAEPESDDTGADMDAAGGAEDDAGAGTVDAAAATATAAGSAESSGTVVIYTSVDQNFSEPILNAFEEQTGIDVQPVFDVEAAKTTGLVNRLKAERDRPQADVWWNGEFAQTVDLANDGILQPYASPNAADIPEQFVDAQNLWTGFGGRARVLLVNTERLTPDQYPDSIYDIPQPDVPADQVGMALPMFGTTATQVAALYAALGPEAAQEFFESIEASDVQIVDGNSVVRDMVADGRLAWGITDTDDACGALERDAPVATVFPDQGEGELGTLVIPNTVAMVSGAPHPTEAAQLIDYLLSEDVARRLVADGWFQVLLRPIEVEEACIDASGVVGMDVSLTDIAEEIETAVADMTELYTQ